MLDLWVGIINLNKAKYLKKTDEKLRPVTWHPARQWDWCVSEILFHIRYFVSNKKFYQKIFSQIRKLTNVLKDYKIVPFC